MRHLRNWFCAVCLLGLAASGQAWVPHPESTILLDGTPQLIIGEQIARALREHDPKFKPFTWSHFSERFRRFYKPSNVQLPFAVRGDFNGDGFEDLTVFGQSGTENVILFLLSSGWSYQIYEYHRNEYESLSQLTYLCHQAPGRIRSEFEEAPLELRHEAVVVGIDGKAAWIVYWDGKQFRRYTTVD